MVWPSFLSSASVSSPNDTSLFFDNKPLPNKRDELITTKFAGLNTFSRNIKGIAAADAAKLNEYLTAKILDRILPANISNNDNKAIPDKVLTGPGVPKYVTAWAEIITRHEETSSEPDVIDANNLRGITGISIPMRFFFLVLVCSLEDSPHDSCEINVVWDPERST
jgi:hypothetical protein